MKIFTHIKSSPKSSENGHLENESKYFDENSMFS